MAAGIVKDKLNELLASEVPGLDRNLPIFDQLNSLELVNLVMLVQKKFSIEIDDIEVNEKLMRTVADLEALIAAKLSLIN